MRVVYALWLRQVKKYFRSRSRIVGSLGQPLLFLLAFGYGFGNVYQRAGEGSYIQFLAPGIIMMSVLFTAVFSGIELIWDRQFGFLKETLAAPVSRLEIMLGRTLGGATVASIQGLIVFVLTGVFGFRVDNLAMLILAAVFVFISALLFTGMGTAIASVMEDMQGFQLIMNFLVMPIFFLSGALYPVEGLPPAMAIITKVNPLTYGVDGLRSTLTNQPAAFGIGLDLSLMVVITALILGIGTYLFSKIQV